MSDDERCGATCRDGTPCQKYPVEGAIRCRMHGGAAENQGPPEGNGNAERHGLESDREKWFERHREDAEPLVRALVASYVRDAPFGWDNVAKVDQLCEVAIDQVRLRQANEYLDEFLTEQVVATDSEGDPVVRVEENPAHMPRDRIKRTNAKLLKELGVLDDPDSDLAESAGSLVEVLKGGDDK